MTVVGSAGFDLAILMRLDSHEAHAALLSLSRTTTLVVRFDMVKYAVIVQSETDLKEK